MFQFPLRPRRNCNDGIWCVVCGGFGICIVIATGRTPFDEGGSGSNPPGQTSQTEVGAGRFPWLRKQFSAP